MVRTQVQFTEHQIDTLRLLAAKRNKSMSDLVRESVDMLLHEQAREVTVQRALNAVGKFRSGRHDGSLNHDDYLAYAYDERGV